MTKSYDHLRRKAVQLRVERKLTLDEIVIRLGLPKSTVYSWICAYPIPQTGRQTAAQRKGTQAMQARYAAEREKAYAQGLDEAPALLTSQSLRDFVILYMAEGTKTRRNEVEFVNSDVQLVKLAHSWMAHFTPNKLGYRLQCHQDHDELLLKQYWAGQLGILPEEIKTIRKSNSGQLAGRNFRSPHGLLSIRVSDVKLRARLQAWMDFIKSQW